MEKILIEDLIQYKLLPFDLYNEKGMKLISAGEILTSGKLLRASQYDVLYKDVPLAKKNKPEEPPAKTPPSQTDSGAASKEKIEEKPKKRSHFIVEDNVVNNKSKINPDLQVSMKAHYAKSMNSLKQDLNKSAIEKLNDTKSKILAEINTIVEDVKFCSQLKLLGDYYSCHALNTAILAATLGHKLEFDTDKIESLTHSALLHDIGMIKFSTELLNKAKLSNKEAALLERHTLIGFKILKDEMKMPEEVCLAALEHHENNDGSGYPYGISGNQISEMSQIIGICSFFDDLTSGKTKYKVKNTKDALKIMLEHGSRRFSPELLYKFVNMFKYNDIFPFDEMVR